jgi:hypothetical protein
VLPPFMRHPPSHSIKESPPGGYQLGEVRWVTTAQWRLHPLFALDGRHQTVYGWNLIDPRGLVRASFLAPLNSVADEARRQMKGMRTN